MTLAGLTDWQTVPPLFLTFAPPHLLALALALRLILICFLSQTPIPPPAVAVFFLPDPGLHLFSLFYKGSSPEHNIFSLSFTPSSHHLISFFI